MRISIEVARIVSDEVILASIRNHACDGEPATRRCPCDRAIAHVCPHCGEILAMTSIGLPCEHITELWEFMAREQIARRAARQ